MCSTITRKTYPRIYRQVRPGADYNWSLKLLERFKEAHPEIPTKSGLMVGLGETNEEIIEVMRDLRRHGVTMLTLGQYLQPSRHHLPVQRYVSPDEFDEMKAEALAMGFTMLHAVRLSALLTTPICRRKGWKLSNPVIITYICLIKPAFEAGFVSNKILRERPARHVTLYESFSA